jgi:hypothetical protein
MAVITAQGFADRNQTIDWLRSQGFPFARASWLERIHHNGGKPIYQPDAGAKKVRAKAVSGGTAQEKSPTEARAAPAPSTEGEAARLEALVASAKGYRPLYVLLENAIRAAIPSVTISGKSGYISFGAPREFAVIAAGPTELRLGLDLGQRETDAHVQKSRIKGPASSISHMVVLTDARQVNADLAALVHAANARVNG